MLQTFVFVHLISITRVSSTLHLWAGHSGGISAVGAARRARVYRAASVQPQGDQLFREETLKRNLWGLWVTAE